MKAKLLLILALHGAAAFDSWSTARALRAGGVEANPLLGRHPGAARVWLQIPGDALIADVAVLRSRRHERAARVLAAAVIAEHVAGGVRDIQVVDIQRERATPAPRVRGK